MKLIRASAPGRCGIIGNPTDGYGGTVISCSLELRARVEVKPSDSLRIIVSESEIELSSTEDFELKKDHFDIPKAILQFMEMTGEGLEIRSSSDIPFCAGLAGSSATLAAIYGALAAWRGIEDSPYMAAEKIHRIEQTILKVQCGFQDHYMAVFGGLQCMDFRGKEDCEPYETGVFASMESLASLVPELPFILAHTGIEHNSGNVHRPIRERWMAGDRDVIEGYTRISYLARQGKKALINRDWKTLGNLMNENHEIQKGLGGSGEVNELMIGAARKAGALGAKLAGAGQGGTIIALATDPEPVLTSLKEAGATQLLFPKPSPGLQLEIVN